MHFHEPEVDMLTYFLSHPGYWGGIIVVILTAALLRTWRDYRRETKTPLSGIGWWVYLFIFLLFVISGLSVLYHKIVYLAMFWY